MEDLLPLLVTGCGLLFTAQGAWGLLSAFLTRRQTNPTADPRPESPKWLDRKFRTKLGLKRLSGAFWFTLGCFALWLAYSRSSWTLLLVGLFWAGIGAWEFLSTFRASKRAEIAAEAHAKSASANVLASGVTLCIGVGLLYLSGAHIGAAPVAVSQPLESNDQLAQIVMQHVQQAFAQEARIGIVVGAIAKDEEVLLGFGARKLGDSQPPDADTVFEIGSITKAFTGILLAQQIESGKLKLDDRVAELLPEGWSLSESARDITLRHLTTHTSGLPRLPPNLLGPTVVVRQFFGGDPYHDYSEEAFREALATVELEFQPGSQRSYSNFAIGLLGFVLATQNKSDYETLLISQLCQPLGTTHTTVIDNTWQRNHLPAKYRSALGLGPACIGFESDEWQLPNHLAGAGAIRSTGRDMLRFLKANLGRMSSPLAAAIERSHQQLYQENALRAMGMNWNRSFNPELRQTILWHNGGTGGFRTYLAFTEDHQFGVFVLSNTATSVDDLGDTILTALIQEYTPTNQRLDSKKEESPL